MSCGVIDTHIMLDPGIHQASCLHHASCGSVIKCAVGLFISLSDRLPAGHELLIESYDLIVETWETGRLLSCTF